jgi:hypothetical protein
LLEGLFARGSSHENKVPQYEPKKITPKKNTTCGANIQHKNTYFIKNRLRKRNETTNQAIYLQLRKKPLLNLYNLQDFSSSSFLNYKELLNEMQESKKP